MILANPKARDDGVAFPGGRSGRRSLGNLVCAAIVALLVIASHAAAASDRAVLPPVRKPLASPPASARAQTFPEAEAWFIGTWAVACDSVVQVGNPLVIVFRAPGKPGLLMTLVSRRDAALTSSLTRVTVRSPVQAGRVAVDFDHSDRGINRAMLQISADEYYVAQNIPPDGRMTIREGLSLKTGLPGARYRRCSKG